MNLLKTELEKALDNAQQETILHESMAYGEMTTEINFKLYCSTDLEVFTIITLYSLS